MRHLIGRASPFANLVKVLVLLAAVDWYVRGPFFDTYMVPRYAVGPLLRERGAGSILFDVVARSPHQGIRVAFVGDSTMVAMPGPDNTVVPYLVGQGLRRRFGASQIEVIDASAIGLYAADSLLFVDKLLGVDADVIVYGLLLRAFPRHPAARWTSRVSGELGLGDLERLVAVGAGPWLAQTMGAEQIVGGVVHSEWKTYAYRSSLRSFLLGSLRPFWPAMAAVLQAPPTAEGPVVSPRPGGRPQFDWTRAEYGSPNRNWDALELLGRLCARYGPRRCMIFSGPINPEGRDQLAEPGFYKEYLGRLQDVSDRYGIVYSDCTDGLTSADFVSPGMQGRDAIHMRDSGRATLAARLVEPIADLVGGLLAERTRRTAGAPGTPVGG